MPHTRHLWVLPGEPNATLHTPKWQNGVRLIGTLPEPERGYYSAFFAHLDAAWTAIRPLQLAAESLLFGHSPRDDVAHWLDAEITDNFRWLANACLQMIPAPAAFHLRDSYYLTAAELEVSAPFGPEPPVDELEPEVAMLGRNVRLLAMMECSATFPQALRGIVAPAASAFTAWERELPTVAAPVVQHVVSLTA
ncbi:MAG: hypothetical protein ACJ8GN_28510 [Longimicrobiaceae bacterium]